MDVLLASHSGEPWADQDEQVLASALRARGADVQVAAWDDGFVRWGEADLVVVRSTWDYFDRREEYLDWARRVEAHTRLCNPAEVLAWNTHKGYLAELEERGAPIVPTAFLGHGDRVELAELARDRGWDDLVAKPAIGGGSSGLVRVGADAAGQAALDALLADGDVLVQPFVASVHDGELSIVLFDGEPSHAVRKVPSPGEIRVQVEFGGRYAQVPVPDDAGELARWLVRATGHDLLYARVDLLADDDGAWMVAELEVTEPSLYLLTVPEAAGRLADAAIARIGRPHAAAGATGAPPPGR